MRTRGEGVSCLELCLKLSQLPHLVSTHAIGVKPNCVDVALVPDHGTQRVPARRVPQHRQPICRRGCEVVKCRARRGVDAPNGALVALEGRDAARGAANLVGELEQKSNRAIEQYKIAK